MRAAGLGGLLAVGIAAFYLAGLTPIVSPGRVSAGHAPFDGECMQCHQPAHGVTDLRCERCHDPGASDRWTNASHVLLGSADTRKAAAAPAVRCVQCHAEHRGREHALGAVDDRECAACHGFRALDSHPEFAAVNAAMQTGVGLKFDHDRHLVEVETAGFERCASCHAPTAEQTGFEPIEFERHCQACHVDNAGFVTGRTDPVRAEHVLAPEEVPEGWAADSSIEVYPAARGRLEFGRMRHRDPWTLYNAKRLRRAIDPEGEAAEREALRGQVAWLERQLTDDPFETVPADQLVAWGDALEERLGVLEAARDGGDAVSDERTATALAGMVAAARALARELAALEPAAREEAESIDRAGLRIAGVDLAGTPPARVPADVERRRRELFGVLDTITARGDARLAARAVELRERVTAIGDATDGPQNGDVSSYRGALDALGEVVRAVRDAPDADAQLGAAQLDRLRAFARQRIAGGVPLDEFEERRRQVLSLLTAVARTGGGALRARAALLRQRALEVRAGDDGAVARRRWLERLRKDLARVRLALELSGHGRPGLRRTAAVQRDRGAVEDALRAARERLAELERGSRPGLALTDAERERQSVTLEALLLPCLKCHELSGPQLAPVAVAEPVMARARFNHAPHLLLADCASCHGSVTTSGLATDVNVPGVDGCRACHQADEARADCAGCHVYHPPAVTALLDGGVVARGEQ